MNDRNNVFFRCVEDCSEAIMITDKDRCLTYVNPAWTKTYGYAMEEVRGRTPAIIRSGLQEKNFYDKMWSEIINKGQWKGELINRTKDGTLIPVILTIDDYRSPTGELLGYVGIAVDITSRKQLEAEVIHQDRLASVGVLASGLAHEVGTPLGVIRGRAEFLQMELADNSKAHKALEIIISQIDRISNLISTLLSYSRSSTDLNIKYHSLRPLIEEISLLIGEKLSQRQIQLETEIPEEFNLYCDYNRTQQILINLIINSIHAIEALKDPNHLRKITISIKFHSQKAILTVADTGCGIPTENMKKIFHPFFTTKDVGDGTGLGLAIVSKLMSEMDARIAVNSIVGQGTSFNLTFKQP